MEGMLIINQQDENNIVIEPLHETNQYNIILYIGIG